MSGSRAFAEGGWTLLDLIGVIAGIGLGIWLSASLQGSWGEILRVVLAVGFGIGFWTLMSAWVLPLFVRRRANPPEADRS
jgi:hypothetical protein